MIRLLCASIIQSTQRNRTHNSTFVDLLSVELQSVQNAIDSNELTSHKDGGDRFFHLSTLHQSRFAWMCQPVQARVRPFAHCGNLAHTHTHTQSAAQKTTASTLAGAATFPKHEHAHNASESWTLAANHVFTSNFTFRIRARRRSAPTEERSNSVETRTSTEQCRAKQVERVKCVDLDGMPSRWVDHRNRYRHAHRTHIHTCRFCSNIDGIRLGRKGSSTMPLPTSSRFSIRKQYHR